MSDISESLKQRIEELKEMGKDIGERLNAAGAEARERWESEFEPQLKDADSMVTDATNTVTDKIGKTADEVVNDLKNAFQAFKDALEKKPEE